MITPHQEIASCRIEQMSEGPAYLIYLKTLTPPLRITSCTPIRYPFFALLFDVHFLMEF